MSGIPDFSEVELGPVRTSAADSAELEAILEANRDPDGDEDRRTRPVACRPMPTHPRSTERSELLIFLTPKVVSERAAVR